MRDEVHGVSTLGHMGRDTLGQASNSYIGRTLQPLCTAIRATTELAVTKRGASCRIYDEVGGMPSGIMNWDSWS